MRTMVYLPEDLHVKLRVHCAATRRSLSDFLTQSAEELLAREETPTQ